ncbi:MAG TPA: nucleotidyltransferase [Tepidiformaceae bacterium]|nr:nucleotidyltransferase [Tepidiformaceae bacterium]
MPDEQAQLFTAEEILELLTELGDRLAARDEAVDAYIVGGTAIAVTLGSRRITEDVDALFTNQRVAMEVGEEIASERGISSHWLNSRIQSYIPSGAPADDTEATTLTFGGLTVRLASPRWLLAMKMAAGRRKDTQDIVDLIRHLDMHSAEEIVDWTIEVHGEGSVILQDPRESLILQAEEMLRLAWPGEA